MSHTGHWTFKIDEGIPCKGGIFWLRGRNVPIQVLDTFVSILSTLLLLLVSLSSNRRQYSVAATGHSNQKLPTVNLYPTQDTEVSTFAQRLSVWFEGALVACRLTHNVVYALECTSSRYNHPHKSSYSNVISVFFWTDVACIRESLRLNQSIFTEACKY